MSFPFCTSQCWIAGVAQKRFKSWWQDRTLINAISVSWPIKDQGSREAFILSSCLMKSLTQTLLCLKPMSGGSWDGQCNLNASKHFLLVWQWAISNILLGQLRSICFYCSLTESGLSLKVVDFPFRTISLLSKLIKLKVWSLQMVYFHGEDK